MVMAWKVVECGTRKVPWDGEVEGYVYWALLMDKRTGEELEFELFSGIYYGAEEEDDLGIVEVTINGAVDFSEMFPLDEEERVMRKVKRMYRDIIDAIRRECDEFVL
jgi:hypothetical protein